MKRWLLISSFMLMMVSSHAQTSADSLYIVTYTTGPAWDATKSPNEQPYFKEHSSNLSKLRQAGIIKAGARYAEKGMIVLSAKSFMTAKEIIFADVAVINKLFLADVQKLNVFYEGCLERPK
jgi:hypothetical protein